MKFLVAVTVAVVAFLGEARVWASSVDQRLIDAIWANDYATAQQMLDAGSDPNTLDTVYTNSSVLELAVKNNHVTMAELLLRYGASINAEDDTGNTPLYYAAMAGNWAMVEMLIANGADTTVDNAKACNRTILASCVRASPENHCNAIVMQVLILAGGDVEAQDCQGNSVAELVNDNENNEFTYAFNQFAFRRNSTKNRNGTSTRLTAATTMKPASDAPNRLIRAIRRNDLPGVNSFLELDNIDPESEGGRTHWTALVNAVIFNRTEIAKLLLLKGANSDRPDDSGNVPLYYAIRLGYHDIAQLLLDDGANANAVNRINCDRTLLMACLTPGVVIENQCDAQLVQMLVQNGANPEAYDCSGTSALSMAQVLGNKEILQILDPNYMLYENQPQTTVAPVVTTANGTSGSNGTTVGPGRHLNKTSSNASTTSEGEQFSADDLFETIRKGDLPKLYKILDSGSVDINAVTDPRTNLSSLMFSLDGRYPNQPAVVKALLIYGADVNETYDGLLTTVHAAAVLGNVPLLHVLLDHGCDPNAVTSDCNSTPLMACARPFSRATVGIDNRCNEIIVRLLVKYGANPNAVNCQDQTALQLAARNPNMKIFQAIQEATGVSGQGNKGGSSKMSYFEVLRQMLLNPPKPPPKPETTTRRSDATTAAGDRRLLLGVQGVTTTGQSTTRKGETVKAGETTTRAAGTTVAGATSTGIRVTGTGITTTSHGAETTTARGTTKAGAAITGTAVTGAAGITTTSRGAETTTARGTTKAGAAITGTAVTGAAGITTTSRGAETTTARGTTKAGAAITGTVVTGAAGITTTSRGGGSTISHRAETQTTARATGITTTGPTRKGEPATPFTVKKAETTTAQAGTTTAHGAASTTAGPSTTRKGEPATPFTVKKADGTTTAKIQELAGAVTTSKGQIATTVRANEVTTTRRALEATAANATTGQAATTTHKAGEATTTARGASVVTTARGSTVTTTARAVETTTARGTAVTTARGPATTTTHKAESTAGQVTTRQTGSVTTTGRAGTTVAGATTRRGEPATSFTVTRSAATTLVPTTVSARRLLVSNDTTIVTGQLCGNVSKEDLEDGENLPWDVRLSIKFVNQTNETSCTAVLISQVHMLSSKHCFEGGVVARITALLNDDRQLLVNLTHVHPNYTRDARRFDFALLEHINATFNFTQDVHAICLPSADLCRRNLTDIANQTVACHVSGLTTDNETVNNSPVSLLTHDKCVNITESEHCVNSTIPRSCIDDRGSSLICSAAGRYYLHGLSSTGQTCHLNTTPSMYSNLCPALDWLYDWLLL